MGSSSSPRVVRIVPGIGETGGSLKKAGLILKGEVKSVTCSWT